MGLAANVAEVFELAEDGGLGESGDGGGRGAGGGEGGRFVVEGFEGVGKVFSAGMENEDEFGAEEVATRGETVYSIVGGHGLG